MRQEAIDRKGAILSAYLGEYYRKDGEPRQRILKYLDCLGEGHIATRATGALIDFWNKANKALAELDKQGLSTDEIARVRKILAAKIQPPSGEEVQKSNAMMVIFPGTDSEFLHRPELSGEVDK